MPGWTLSKCPSGDGKQPRFASSLASDQHQETSPHGKLFHPHHSLETHTHGAKISSNAQMLRHEFKISDGMYLRRTCSILLVTQISDGIRNVYTRPAKAPISGDPHPTGYEG